MATWWYIVEKVCILDARLVPKTHVLLCEVEIDVTIFVVENENQFSVDKLLSLYIQRVKKTVNSGNG